MLTDRLARLLQRALDRITDPDEAQRFLSERVRVENYWTFQHFRDGKQIDEWAFENLVVTAGLNALLGNTFDAAAGSVAWYVALIGAGAGTVAINASSASVTGSSTTFDAALAVAPVADIIIVGAGSAGADLVQTISARGSNTALTLGGNAATTVSGAAYATEPVPADTMASHINSWSETTPYSDATRPAWTKNGSPTAGAMSNSASKASFTINATGRVFGAALVSNNTKGGTTGTLYGGGLFTSQGSRAVLSGDTLNAQVDVSATAA